MEKRLLFVFLFVLWINVSLQTSAADKLEASQNDTEMILLYKNARDYFNSRLSTVIIPVIYILLLPVGILANVGFFFVLIFKTRKVSDILYRSLVVSDLFLLLSLAFRVDYHLRGNNWVHGEAACRAVTACSYGSVYASAVTLAFISLDRYLTQLLDTTLVMHRVRVILGVWVVFVVAIVPELAVKQSYHVSDLDITTCHDVFPLNDSSYKFMLNYNRVLFVLFLLVPLVVNVVCCTRVIYELNRTKLNSEEKTTFRAQLLTLVIFLLCFVPAAVLNSIYYLHVLKDDDNLFMGFNVAACLYCYHACNDPLLYIFRSETARSIIKRLLKRKTSTTSV